jgi:hypothetical protein
MINNDSTLSDGIRPNDGPYDESLEEALIDLYLSVKIRSNEEVSEDVYHHFFSRFKLLMDGAIVFFRLTTTTKKSCKKSERDFERLTLSPSLSTSRHPSKSS